MGRDASKIDAWSDADLTNAVLASRSWRGVMRELGLCATSSGSLLVVKRRVTILGLDTSHFTGQRTWSDAALKRAAAQAHSWNELLSAIGMKSNSGDERIRVKAHALRLGLDLSHLEDQPQETHNRSYANPALRNLREAAHPLPHAGFPYAASFRQSQWNRPCTIFWYRCRTESNGFRLRRPRITAGTDG